MSGPEYREMEDLDSLSHDCLQTHDVRFIPKLSTDKEQFHRHFSMNLNGLRDENEHSRRLGSSHATGNASSLSKHGSPRPVGMLRIKSLASRTFSISATVQALTSR